MYYDFFWTCSLDGLEFSRHWFQYHDRYINNTRKNESDTKSMARFEGVISVVVVGVTEDWEVKFGIGNTCFDRFIVFLWFHLVLDDGVVPADELKSIEYYEWIYNEGTKDTWRIFQE